MEQPDRNQPSGSRYSGADAPPDFQNVPTAEEFFAGLSFSEKMRASWALTKEHWLQLFLVGLACVGLALGVTFLVASVFGLPAVLAQSLGGASGVAAGGASLVMGFLAAGLVFFFLTMFLGLGYCSLILSHIDGREEEGVLGSFTAPWSRFGTVILCSALWLLVWLILSGVMLVVGLIPVLGMIISFAADILMTLVYMCVLYYLAEEYEYTGILEVVTRPFRLVVGHIWAWLAALALTMGLVVAGIVVLMLLMAFLGGFSTVVALIFAVVYFGGISIYGYYLYGLTYKQSRALLD